MKFDQMLNRELKEMSINEIDIASKVIGHLKSKKRYNFRKYILVAVMLFVTVTTAFALDWITFNDGGSYTLSSENKKWEQQFSMVSDVDNYEKYIKIQDDLDKKSNELGVNLFGYYSSDEFEHPIVVWSNHIVFYDDFNLLNEETNYKWIDVIKDSISEDYEFNLSSVQYTYPGLLERYEYAKEHIRDGLLYFEEITSEKEVFSMQLHYIDSIDRNNILSASIVTKSSYNCTNLHHIDSEVIEINGVPAVYSILSDNYKMIELVYDGNLLRVSGNESKEILTEFMSHILNNYNKQNIN